ncbi:MAG: flagellar biosynthesis protein FlhB [Pseudomonadaceae bacterium]|nr:flagellar biosynthesis protein FlhB [Pseudomonadaceae bacterium]
MAESEDQSSKTEEPTERKLQKLRDEGNVPTSKEVNHLFALLGMLVVIGLVGPVSMGSLADLTGAILQNAGQVRLDSLPAVGAAFSHAIYTGLMLLLPILLVLLVLAWFGGIIQNGVIYSAKPISPNLEKISPLAGLKRMFSLKSVAELLKALLKFVVIGAAMAAVVAWAMPHILQLSATGMEDTLTTTYWLMVWLTAVALFIMMFLAAADFLFQRFQYIQKNKMSLKELKDEFKESEGDPHVKQRQRQIRMERARKRMMSNVPKSDVVITNPTHYSVALRYKPDDGDAAPTVVAKGVDHMAMRIREVARDHNVPLYEDPPLARMLYAQVEVDQEIPLQLYEVVAKVIAFVMDVKRRAA